LQVNVRIAGFSATWIPSPLPPCHRGGHREYRRFFGLPPIRDIKTLRDGKVVAITTA
jgi:hypothetical protein